MRATEEAKVAQEAREAKEAKEAEEKIRKAAAKVMVWLNDVL
jgi:hypothetical protein